MPRFGPSRGDSNQTGLLKPAPALIGCLQALRDLSFIIGEGDGSKYPKIQKFFIDPLILCLKISQTPLPPL